MQIIDELETEKRGLYAGSVGYFSAAGEMDTCIVAAHRAGEDGVSVRAGRRPGSSRIQTRSPSSRNASTRRRRCFALRGSAPLPQSAAKRGQ